MTCYVSHTTVDCADAYALSRWWQAVLDYVEYAEDPNEPGDEECMILSRDGRHRLLFIEVPDAKQVKNRVHLDLRPVDGPREAEVARVVELGATVVADHRSPDGLGWVVLADPEGNEFCILRSDAEVAAWQSARQRAAAFAEWEQEHIEPDYMAEADAATETHCRAPRGGSVTQQHPSALRQLSQGQKDPTREGVGWSTRKA